MNDMEKRIKDAFENAAPDVLDAVLARCTTQKGAVTPMKKKKNPKMRKFLNFTAAAAIIALLFGIGYVGAAVLMPDAPAGPYDNGQMNTPIETAPTNNATDPQPDIDIIPEPGVDDPIQTQPTDPDNTIGPMTQDEAVKLAMEDAFNYLITLNAFTGNPDEMDVFSVLYIDEYYRIVLHQEDCGALNLQFQFVYFVNSFTGEVYTESVASNLDTVIGQVMIEKEKAIDIALLYLGLTRDAGEIEANLVADNTVWEICVTETKRGHLVYIEAFTGDIIKAPGSGNETSIDRKKEKAIRAAVEDAGLDFNMVLSGEIEVTATTDLLADPVYYEITFSYGEYTYMYTVSISGKILSSRVVQTTPEQLDSFEAMLGNYQSWYNKAIRYLYDDPTRLALRFFFVNGFAGESQEPTNAEWAQLQDVPGFNINDDLFRLPRVKMNDVLTQYFGITLEDLDAECFKDLVYLESTDCYYFMATGVYSAAENVDVLYYEKFDDGTIIVTYTADIYHFSDGKVDNVYEVGMKLQGGEFVILFNRVAENAD